MEYRCNDDVDDESARLPNHMQAAWKLLGEAWIRGCYGVFAGAVPLGLDHTLTTTMPCATIKCSLYQNFQHFFVREKQLYST
jgi:hypothetical protein